MNPWVLPFSLFTIVGIFGGFYLGFYLLTEYPLEKESKIDPNVNPLKEESKIDPIVKAPVNVLALTEKKSETSLYLADIGIATTTDSLTPVDQLIITHDAPQPDENGILFPLGTTTVTWTANDRNGILGVAYQNVTVLENSFPVAEQNNKRIMVNFDDGFDNVYDLGLPVLDKYGIKTTQYIICGKPTDSKNGFMTWDNIRSMAASGHDIQSHSMSHLDANTLSQDELDAEYGQDVIDCFAENGIFDIRMMSFPLSRGWDDPKIINTIDDTYEFARGGSTNVVSHLHCNTGAASNQENCETYTSEKQNELNQFNRYNILAWKHDTKFKEEGFNEAAMLFRFIEFVNSSSKNSENDTLDIPIVVYRQVVLDNSNPDPKFQGVTVTLLDAEMKYLFDNNFTVFTTKDFQYDDVNNWITIAPSE